MNKAEIIARMLAFEKSLIGMDYSKTYRYKPYKDGSADCSSLQAMAMSFAGYPLVDDNGKSLLTSCYEVYAKGYDLIYPASSSLIGKKLPSASNLCTTYGAQPGDLVFFNFDSDTSRANKITHIAAVLDSGHYIHTANNREKCCIVPITWGRAHICAIIRLKDNVQSMSLPTLKKGEKNTLGVKMLQANLNNKVGSKLEWDGSFGSGTEAALKQYQMKVGLAPTGVCDKDVWDKLLGVKPVPTYAFQLARQLEKDVKDGADIKAVQQRLLALGYKLPKYGADGDFGNETEAAVKAFQTDKKLKVDGVVGPKTCAALGGQWLGK